MVQCKNLTKKYGSKVALRDATLHIREIFMLFWGQTVPEKPPL